MTNSFWVIPDEIKIKTPLALLREQASALTTMTKGLLVGEVKTGELGGRYITVRLDITVPSLNAYRYTVLEYIQPPLIFPGTLYDRIRDEQSEAFDEYGFTQAVRNILSSEQAQRIIEALLAQAQDSS
ncbi:hypothetical protein [Mesorhizobium sp. CA7]|uniref:hypothetical protein n=1 Tax=Mesorhizobium sp. CA7 TaxID=588501 RepID=UPI001CC99604|nr:hypothetical protein [Mesorhizobium sp. CA7]MBZ9817447.1 hypothetical protein [Mesorhizobium sp. CA7]